MPLSEDEYQILAQIESALCAEDPKFASRVRNNGPRASTIGRIQGAALFMVGLAALVSGLAVKATMIGGFPALSVFGFLVMWSGAVHVVTEPVILGARRMAASAARWALQEPRRSD